MGLQMALAGSLWDYSFQEIRPMKNYTQIPLRQALILATYGIQETQLPRYIIAKTRPQQLYVQMSRGTQKKLQLHPPPTT